MSHITYHYDFPAKHVISSPHYVFQSPHYVFEDLTFILGGGEDGGGVTGMKLRMRTKNPLKIGPLIKNIYFIFFSNSNEYQ